MDIFSSSDVFINNGNHIIIFFRFMDCIETFNNYINNIKPYKNWEKEQLVSDQKRQYLFKHGHYSEEEIANGKRKAETILRAVDIMDDYSEKKSEDVEAFTQIMQGYAPILGGLAGYGITKLITRSEVYRKYLFSIIDKPKKLALISSTVNLLPMTLGFIGLLSASTIYFTKMQRDAAAIARFQSIKEELNNPKNFVDFTDDQLNEARENAKNLALEEKKEANPLNPLSSASEVYQTFKSISKDKNAFKQWEQDINNIENNRKILFSAKLQDETIKEADESKNLITRIITKIDIASQKYSEDAEMTANMLTLTCSLSGGLTGLLAMGAQKVLEKAKLVKVNSNTSKLVFQNASLFLGLIGAVLGSLYSLKYQKEASRVGKYKAKLDFINHPENYLNFNKEDLDKVTLPSDKVEKKSLWKKLTSIFANFTQLKNEFKDYENYKNGARKDENKFRKALLDVNVSEKQFEKGKKLQANVFRTFNKMDENSVRYTEDMETITDIVIPIATQVLSLGLAATGGILLPKTKIYSGLSNDKKMIAFVTILSAPLILFGMGAQYISTKLQKNAGKIGLMKAMQELNDPKNFVADEDLLKANNISDLNEASKLAFNNNLGINSYQNDILVWLESLEKHS